MSEHDEEEQVQEETVHTIDDILKNAIACGFRSFAQVRLLLNFGTKEEPVTPLDLCQLMNLSPSAYQGLANKLKVDGLMKAVKVGSKEWMPMRTAKGQRIIDHIFDGAELEEGDIAG